MTPVASRRRSLALAHIWKRSRLPREPHAPSRAGTPRFFRSERGSEIIEFGFVILPLFALVFLNMDAAWVIFAKASLQYAVRQGCRYAVTGQVIAGLGEDASIKTVVANNSFGFLSGTNSQNNISIQYFNPVTLKATTSNAGGNIVQVSINNASIAPLAPLWRSSDPLQVSVVSSDVVEASPGGIPPPR